MCIFAGAKDIFGKPNEGIHSYRLFNIAIVDFVGTVIGAAILAKWLNISFIFLVIILLVLGEIFHYLFGVETAVIKFLQDIKK